MQCYVMIELTTVLYLGLSYPLLHLLLTDVDIYFAYCTDLFIKKTIFNIYGREKNFFLN